MRTFIAIELDPTSKDVLYRVQKEIKKKVFGAKWVGYENLHITLKFIGEVRAREVEELKKAIKKVSSDVAPFTISGGKFGAFPSLMRARVLFFGIEEGKASIYRLFDKLEQELVKLGFERDARPFHPHITIARVKRGVFDASSLSGLRVEFSQTAKGITLFKSTLTPEGPIYTPIERGEFM